MKDFHAVIGGGFNNYLGAERSRGKLCWFVIARSWKLSEVWLACRRFELRAIR